MKKQTYTLGRAAGNDIRIEDISISRRHAVLTLLKNGQVQVMDCGSKNGVFVNGIRVRKAIVTNGDSLAFGSYRCSLRELLPQRPAPRRKRALFLKLMGVFCVLALAFALYQAFPAKVTPLAAPSPAPPARVAPQAPQGRQAEQSLQERVERATVLVLSNAGSGSGFFITPNTVVTNRHVIQNAREILLVNKFLGRGYSARVTAVSRAEGQDYAVLVTEVNNAFYLPLCPRVSRGAQVSSWGYPGFITDRILQARVIPEVLLTSGEVSAVQAMDGSVYILHTAQVSYGNSGGPLVNKNGSVAGINTFVAPDSRLNSQFSIALSARDLMAFLRSCSVPFVEGE